MRPDVRVAPAFLAPPVFRAEQRHRRLVVGGVTAIVALSLMPIAGHHIATQLDAALVRQDHVAGLCLIALHLLVSPLHDLLHLLVIGGAVYAIGDRLRAAFRVRRSLRTLSVVTDPDSALDDMVHDAGLRPDQVRVVSGLPNPAFTAGWFTPRIYLAQHARELLRPDELRAVLRHEAVHLRRRDPLRLSLMRFTAQLLFWLPALRRLERDMADEAEIRADDEAAASEPLALASAILALARWRATFAVAPSAASFQVADVASLLPSDRQASSAFDPLLDRRVRRLAGQPVRHTTHLTARSVLGAVCMLALVAGSGIVSAHPMPGHAGDHGAPHCNHNAISALSHVFCLDDHEHASPGAVPTSADCPHGSHQS